MLESSPQQRVTLSTGDVALLCSKDGAWWRDCDNGLLFGWPVLPIDAGNQFLTSFAHVPVWSLVAEIESLHCSSSPAVAAIHTYSRW
jgi:hypothetical protein